MQDSIDIKKIPLNKIFLDLDNPRHKQFVNQKQAIEYLCQEELVYELAKDIARYGINPLEILGLLVVKKGQAENYTVLEGNRRMCAIMLLNDPALAPAKYRKDFTKLSENISPIKYINAMLFRERKEAHIWLERIHGGLQGGAGRKAWNPDQKTRHTGNTTNTLAQAVLDYAEKESLISAENRKGKLTTVQRYLSNPLFRDALGIDNRNIDDISRTRPKGDFNALLKRFLDDLNDPDNKDVSSRSNKPEIERYSRTIVSTERITNKRTEPESIAENVQPTVTGGKKKSAPKKPGDPKNIEYSKEIYERIKAIPSYKLDSMYYSLCSIDLQDHTPLLCVGVWAFLECLTAKIGKDGNVDFFSFLSNERLSKLGFDKDSKKPIVEALSRIQKYGNTTKHHESSANFNGNQLHNDMETIKQLLCKLSEQAKTVSP